jgi:transposase-like protein
LARPILGLDVVTAEDGAGWLAFLRGLRARGLNGVELVISDAHPRLKDAISSVLRGAAWQRCRTHFIRNLLTRAARPDGRAPARPLSESGRHARRRCRGAAAFTGFPKEHWR